MTSPAAALAPADGAAAADARATDASAGILAGGRLGGLDPADLAARFGTPFYAYDLDLVAGRVHALRGALPAGVELAYAVKANPNLAVLRHLAGLGLGADVASGGELRHVIGRGGFAPSRVVFTGPGKRDEELRAAVEACVRVVTVESPRELRRLALIAESLGRVQPVLLRAAVPEAAAGERIRIIGDGGAGKFGMDGGDLRAAAAEAVASPWLDPLGLHAFGASNVTDAAVLARHVEATVEAALEVAAGAGFALRLVDAGGGLGIPYADGEPALDLGALGALLAPIAERLASETSAAGARILLEPGRFLVGPAGAYVARVVDRKRVGGTEVAILDGGINHVLRPALVGQEHRVRLLTGAGATIRSGASAGAGAAAGEPAGGSGGGVPGDAAHAAPGQSITVAGPLCTGLDVFASAASMPAPVRGDLVAVLDVGAYGATESMPFFISHALPAEVAIRGGQAWLARPRVEPDTWLDWQVGEPPPGPVDAAGELSPGLD
jgi:diaminopimelate decarboxylase